MGGIWRYSGDGPKYLVQRRDGTVPEWPWFVLGAKDGAAPAAIRAYAAKAYELGYDAQYVDDLYRMADEFEAYLASHGTGDPDAPKHRIDDATVVAKLRRESRI